MTKTALHKWNVPLLLTLILSGLLLSACSDSRTEIVFVFLSSSPDTLEAYWEGVIEDFEAANPDVRVDLRVYKWKDGRPKIEEMIADGRPPDLSNEAVRRVPEYVSKGLVELVDDYMTPEFKSQFIPLLIEEGSRYQGRTFGLPVSLSARVLYYNQGLFDQAGVTGPPESWEELRQAALAVSALADDVYGFGIPADPASIEVSTYYYYFLWGNGGRVFSPDGTKAGFDQPEGVEALAFLNSLVQERAAPPNPWDYSRSAMEDAFVAGKLGMVITLLPRLASRLDQEAPDLNYGLAPLPYETAPVTPLVEDTLIMYKTSEHKALVWRFIEFIYQDPYRKEYSEVVGVLPEKVSVAQDVAQDPEVAELYAFFLDVVENGRFEPLNIESANVASIVGEAIREVYQGQKDPQEALEAAAAAVNDILFYSASAW